MTNVVKRVFCCKISFGYSRERARQKIEPDSIGFSYFQILLNLALPQATPSRSTPGSCPRGTARGTGACSPTTRGISQPYRRERAYHHLQKNIGYVLRTTFLGRFVKKCVANYCKILIHFLSNFIRSASTLILQNQSHQNI